MSMGNKYYDIFSPYSTHRMLQSILSVAVLPAGELNYYFNYLLSYYSASIYFLFDSNSFLSLQIEN